MRIVLSNDPGIPRPRVFAHVLDDGTIDILREGHRITVIGEQFTLIGTNPQGNGKTILQVKDGKLVEDDLQFKTDDPITPPESKDETQGESKDDQE